MLLQMNQLCKVCGEPAAGFHFGAFTCEGCKSFFGRTYNNISAIAGCKNNGDCVINKKNRTACKACRLRKCLLVGMSKSGSRYGRRSNWFKIHCLLQEQQTQQVPGSVGSGGASGGGIGGGGNNLEQLARLHQMQARQTYQDKTNPCIKTASMSPTLALPSAIGQSYTSNAPAMQPQNFLSAAKFLNGVVVGNNQNNTPTKSEPRLSNTPSDSGASSAGDPGDDCRSTASGRQHKRNCNSAHQPETVGGNGVDNDECDRRRKQFLQIFRSHSEPLRSPFVPFAITNLPPPILAGTPPAYILPALKEDVISRAATLVAAAAGVDAEEHVVAQDQPIDLSLKSRASQRSHASLSPTSELHEVVVNVIQKPTPLDLTLVRTQSLTG